LQLTVLSLQLKTQKLSDIRLHYYAGAVQASDSEGAEYYYRVMPEVVTSMVN